MSDVEAEERPLRQPPRWIAIVTGLLTIALLAFAVADIGMQMSRLGADTATVASAPAAPTSAALPPPATAVPFSVIATPCQPGSTNGVTADGSVAYCGPLQTTNIHLWSLVPGEIAMPMSHSAEPEVGVCMEQTSRSEQDCREYLTRPSNPGDGGA